MKITLTPAAGQSTFSPTDLHNQLGKWLAGTLGGDVTVRVTLGGKIKELTLDITEEVEDFDV